MCQRLFIASLKPLQEVVRSRSDSALEVYPADKSDARIRGLFPVQEFPHLYAAGAHSSCGCGFPELLPSGGKRFKDEPEERATMRRLVEVLRPAVSSRPRVQLYLCFMGDEGQSPQGRRSVGLAELQEPAFCFRNLEVVTVFKGAAA